MYFPEENVQDYSKNLALRVKRLINESKTDTKRFMLVITVVASIITAAIGVVVFIAIKVKNKIIENKEVIIENINYEEN